MSKVHKLKSYFKSFLKNEKDRILIFNTLSAFLIKGAALVVSLFSFPIYLRYFESEAVLGVWFTILSVLIWILSFDFGIGNGLRNRLVSELVNKDEDMIKESISSSYFLMGFISLLTFTFGLIIIPFINWNTFFNVSNDLLSESTMRVVVIIVFATIVIQFFLRMINFILYALQKSATNNFIALISSISQVGIVLVLPSVNAETNLVLLAIVYLFTVNLPLIIVTILVFSKDLRGYSPKLRHVNIITSKSILHFGGIFFWNQIMYTALTGTNAFFISRLLKPSMVVEYQIYYRVFSLIGILFSLALTPMWSTITKAFEEDDRLWIKRYFNLLLKSAILVLIFHLLLVPLMQPLTNIWLGNESIKIQLANSLLFSIFGSLFVLQNILSTFACGIGKLKLQFVFYSIGVGAKIILSIVLTRYYPTWIIIVLVDIIVILPYCIFQTIDLKARF